MNCCCCLERPAVLFGRYCSECYWRFTPEALNAAYHGDRYYVLVEADAPLVLHSPVSMAQRLPRRP